MQCIAAFAFYLVSVTKYDLVIFGIDYDRLRSVYFLGQQVFRQLVQDKPVYHSFYRTCSKLRVVAFGCNQAQSFGCNFEGDTVFLQHLFDVVDL